jgi:hypothetical protein
MFENLCLPAVKSTSLSSTLLSLNCQQLAKKTQNDTSLPVHRFFKMVVSFLLVKEMGAVYLHPYELFLNRLLNARFGSRINSVIYVICSVKSIFRLQMTCLILSHSWIYLFSQNLNSSYGSEYKGCCWFSLLRDPSYRLVVMRPANHFDLNIWILECSSNDEFVSFKTNVPVPVSMIFTAYVNKLEWF